MKTTTIRNVIFLVVGLFILISACKKESTPAPETLPVTTTAATPAGTTYLPASMQRSGGNAALGEAFIKTGNFAYAGIPSPQFPLTSFANELSRTGHNASLPFSYTEIDAFNGVKVVAPNCLTCHATYLDNTFILGLGSTTGDYRTDPSANSAGLDAYISGVYGGTQSPEYQAYEPFSNALKAIGPNVLTNTQGVNPADKYALILAAHRDKVDLSWLPTPSAPIPAEVVPTDVPAWWLLKKKNAMYYNGNGQGDFAKIIMASALLSIKDSSYARIVDNQFVDVLEYLKSIEAPVYTQTINIADAEAGKTIFSNNCAKCHGTYGTAETYPNLLVDLNTIQTDPMLANGHMTSTYFTGWYNDSWFGTGVNAGKMVPHNGYVAPPLDGIWATAPYLHNGSVPDLVTLLKSSARPAFWTRTFATTDYNYTNVGWNYTTSTSAAANCYNTTMMGYTNTGHTFGDHLNDSDRMKLIEYLKTL